jgi:multimeric flavodoxin WrbA
MNHFLLINLSPRKDGTSVTLLTACNDWLQSKGHAAVIMHLYPSLKDPAALFDAVSQADTLVFSGPCYINTYPADTVWLLQELAARPQLLHGQAVYGMIQGGMPYAHTHTSGLSMLTLFARQSGLNYKGGFVMGLGAMLNGQPLSKLFNAKAVIRQLNAFFDHVEKGEGSPPEVYEASMLKWPRIKYRLMAIAINRMMDKDLAAHGIDIGQPSPYLDL